MINTSLTVPKRRVFMFDWRFWGPIREGRKTQTMRLPPSPRRPIVPGYHFDLRGWSGRPYGKGSQHILLLGGRLVICDSVDSVSIRFGQKRLPVIHVDGVRLGPSSLLRFIQADGFNGFDDFRFWWLNVRNAPPEFEGVLYRWRNEEVS